MKISSKLTALNQIENTLLLNTDGPDIKIIFLSDKIVRICASFDKLFLEESYSLMLTAWEDRLDELFKNERKRVQALAINPVKNEQNYTITTDYLTVIIHKEPFGITVLDSDGTVLHEDLAGRAFVLDHKERVYHYSKLDFSHDRFYGFGERTGELNKLHNLLLNSPKDSIGHNPNHTNFMYKHIPFYIKLNSENFKPVGYFYHNTYESLFNVGSEISGYWDRYSYFCADGGDLDLFIIAGRNVAEVLAGYTDLTGKPALPTAKSLGYLGSTMYYVELPENCDDEILRFAEKNLELGIPIDGFQLSSGYTVGDANKRYFFYWNRTRFPDPQLFFQKMNNLGIPVSPNIKPGILLSHPFIKTFEDAGAFVKAPDGKQDYIDKWWGGPGKFVDFTNPSARLTWKKHIQEHLISYGVDSIWNDNCEYDSILDREAICNFEGKKASIGQLKSILPNLMNHAAREALLEAGPTKRPYIISRSGFAGIQRYAQTWAGDNYTSWETLRSNLNTIMGMGLSGVPNNGCDVGGFYGPHPEAELFVRWVQSGIFYPRFSIHSSNTDNTVTEPWMYGEEITQLVRDAISLRYKLFPYLYSLMWESSRTGEAIVRPMFYDFCDPEVFHCEHLYQFMFGPSLLVANVLESKAKTRTVYLPSGCDWYDFYTFENFTGGQYIDIDVNLSSIPVFIRDGIILPYTNDIFRIGQDAVKTLKLLITIDSDSNFDLYEDDGIRLISSKADYLQTNISVTSQHKITTISFNHVGAYLSTLSNIEIEVINPEKGAFWVEKSGVRIPQVIDERKFLQQSQAWKYNGANKSVTIKFPYTPSDHEIKLSYQNFDLIGMDE